MRRLKSAVVVLVLIGAAGTLTACGNDDQGTTVTVDRTATESGGGTNTSGAVDTTPGGATVPAVPNCGPGQIYSQGQGACVSQRQGGNPCPPGEIPAADQPACLPKD